MHILGVNGAALINKKIYKHMSYSDMKNVSLLMVGTRRLHYV